MDTKGTYEDEVWMSMPHGMRPGGLELTGQLVRMAALKGGSKILDIGCGMGSTVDYLNGQGFDAAGVDASQKLVQAGRQKYPGTRLLASDGALLPFGDASFDAAFCECSLSAMPARSVLQECCRVLAPGGKALVSDIYARRISHDGAEKSAYRTRGEWEKLFERCGFGIVQFVDATRALTEFAVRFVWEHGSLEKLADCGLCIHASEKPGYFLLMAVKRGD